MTDQQFDETQWSAKTVVTLHGQPGQIGVDNVDFVWREVILKNGDIVNPKHIDRVFSSELVAQAYS